MNPSSTVASTGLRPRWVIASLSYCQLRLPWEPWLPSETGSIFRAWSSLHSSRSSSNEHGVAVPQMVLREWTRTWNTPERWVPTQRWKARGKEARRPGRRSMSGCSRQGSGEGSAGSLGPLWVLALPRGSPHQWLESLFPCFSTWCVDRMCSAFHRRMKGTVSFLKSCLCSWNFSRLICDLNVLVLGAVLSWFSCVRLFATYGLQPTRLLCPWDSPGKNTGMGCHALLQGIFLTQGSNLCLSCLLYW